MGPIGPLCFTLYLIFKAFKMWENFIIRFPAAGRFFLGAFVSLIITPLVLLVYVALFGTCIWAGIKGLLDDDDEEEYESLR